MERDNINAIVSLLEKAGFTVSTEWRIDC